MEALARSAMPTTTTTTTLTQDKMGTAKTERIYKGTDKSASASASANVDEKADLEAKRKRLMDAWSRLVDEGPEGMGRLYKVMAIVPHTDVASSAGDGEHEMRALAGFGN